MQKYEPPFEEDESRGPLSPQFSRALVYWVSLLQGTRADQKPQLCWGGRQRNETRMHDDNSQAICEKVAQALQDAPGETARTGRHLQSFTHKAAMREGSEGVQDVFSPQSLLICPFGV